MYIHLFVHDVLHLVLEASTPRGAAWQWRRRGRRPRRTPGAAQSRTAERGPKRLYRGYLCVYVYIHIHTHIVIHVYIDIYIYTYRCVYIYTHDTYMLACVFAGM